MRGRQVFGVVPAVLAALVLYGCGDGGGTAPEQDAHDHTPPPGTTAETPGDVVDEALIPEPMQAFEDDGDVAEITIESNDLMQFDIQRFSVQPGQMVRLTLDHVGVLPAQAMGHNVVILYPDDDVFEFGADVGEQRGGMHDDYVPASLRDRVVAFTPMIGGGQSATVEFQAPDEPGEYPYLCSFPGHFGQMNGFMVVEE